MRMISTSAVLLTVGNLITWGGEFIGANKDGYPSSRKYGSRVAAVQRWDTPPPQQDLNKEVGHTPLSGRAQIDIDEESSEHIPGPSRTDANTKESRENSLKEYNQMTQMKADRSAAMTSPFGKSSSSSSSSSALHSIEVVTAAGMDRMLTLLLDVSQNLAGLRDITHSLKLQGQTMYKMLKRIEAKQSALQPQSTSARMMNYVEVPEPKELTNKVMQQKGPLSAALVGDEPRSDIKCLRGFVYHSPTDSCFLLSGDRVTWRAAREQCRADAADLVTVDTARKQRYVIDLVRTNIDTQHCDVWIGLTRQHSSSYSSQSSSEKGWHWVNDNDQLATFTNWNIGEPNDANGNEHCAQILWLFNWKWNDAPCQHRSTACYMCESKRIL